MQEHCSAPDMWLRLSNPDVLIYLDVDEDVAAHREGLSNLHRGGKMNVNSG